VSKLLRNAASRNSNLADIQVKRFLVVLVVCDFAKWPTYGKLVMVGAWSDDDQDNRYIPSESHAPKV
jgi:hypothetical protein